MTLRRTVFRAALTATLLAPAGCGWMEFPPRQWQARTPPPRTASKQPPVSAQAAQAARAGWVVVRKGDSVYALSRRHRVGVRSLIDANRLKPPYLLKVGQRLELPKPRDHVVAKGDTLNGISRRYGVGAYALARTNGLKSPYTIRVGQRLRLPDGPAATAAASPPRPAGAGKIASAPLAPPPAKIPAVIPRPPKASGKGFIWPVKGRVLSGFGGKAKGLVNDGINIAAPRGAPVRAAENGVVAYAGNELRGFGNMLLVKHEGGWITAYAHNGELLVKPGSRVRKGEPIARVGSSGNVRTPQLHFELRRGKEAVDPIKYLKT